SPGGNRHHDDDAALCADRRPERARTAARRRPASGAGAVGGTRSAHARCSIDEGGLTGDLMVTYSDSPVEAVFRALAAPPRRRLLDELFKEDGQTLGALERRLPMTRFGVMKHLRVLEEAGLIVTKKRGREKLHFLNPVPIRLVHDRWVSK